MQGRLGRVRVATRTRSRLDWEVGPTPKTLPRAWGCVISKSLSSTKQSVLLEASEGPTIPNMVHIHCAYTEQVNPAGAEPVLSRDQVHIVTIRSADRLHPSIKPID